ncbi:MAG: N,N-dimethylformamidase beta subunit family domain-containing protein, partial [Gaiellaceae bacterium]
MRFVTRWCVVGCAAFVLAVSTAAAGPFGETAPQSALRAGPDRELAAAFRRRSYRPGDRALVVITGHVGGIELGVFRVGPEPRRPRRKDVLLGVPVTEPRHVSWAERRGSRRVPVWVGKWPSGFYFARIRTPDGKVAYAPFIVRPRARGRARLAVVLPTSTWQAYNLRDVDGNGIGDSWYADPAIRSVDLTRPYMNRGVPPHFRKYDLGFIRWLYKRGKDVDFFADDDLARFRRGAGLAKLYDLVVFPGHEEYVTTHAYDVVE